MREFVTGQNLGRWKESGPQMTSFFFLGAVYQSCLSQLYITFATRWFKALAKFPLAILASALLSQTTKHVQAKRYTFDLLQRILEP